jgi:hypothetical protein
MPVFEGSALQQASGAPTTSSIAASHIADSLVRDTCTHLRDSKKQDRQKKGRISLKIFLNWVAPLV